MCELTIAKTILQQMGGSGALAAFIGAYNYVAHEDGVSFKWKAKAKNGANYFRVKLNSMDLYDLEFGRLRNVMPIGLTAEAIEKAVIDSYKVTKEISGVYWDQLIELFEKETGLYLTL